MRDRPLVDIVSSSQHRTLILFTETYRNEKCKKRQQEIERKEKERIELRDAMMIVIFILWM